MIALTCCLIFDLLLHSIVQLEKYFKTTQWPPYTFSFTKCGISMRETEMCCPTFRRRHICLCKITLILNCSNITVKKASHRYRETGSWVSLPGFGHWREIRSERSPFYGSSGSMAIGYFSGETHSIV